MCTLWCLLANLSSTKLLLLLFVTAQLAISAIKHSCEVIFHYFKTRMSSIQLDRIDVAVPQPCSQAFTQHIALRSPTSCLLVSVDFLALMLVQCAFWTSIVSLSNTNNVKKNISKKSYKIPSRLDQLHEYPWRSLMTQFFLSQPATSTDLLLLVHLHNSIILQE